MSRTRLISALAAGLVILVAACWFVTATFPLAAAPQVVNDSPGVTVDLGSAGVMHRTSVFYPAAALKQGVQGTVVVEVKLDSSGNVADAHVVSGPDELRKAALQSVLQWHLAKSLAGSSQQVSISFHLPAPAAQPTPPPDAAPERMARLATAVAAARPVMSQPAWVGRTLKGINVTGLSDPLRADLLLQLQIHEGDTLSAESFAKIALVARGFDEHLSISTANVGSNEVMLVISAPGSATIAPGVIEAVRSAASAGGDATPPSRITVGGNVQQTKLISQPRPVYPPEAKLAQIQGVVKLNATIAKDGTIQHLEVISGHSLLIPSAMEAVRQWVYQPTLLNGEPVEVMTQIDVNYTLAQ